MPGHLHVATMVRIEHEAREFLEIEYPKLRDRQYKDHDFSELEAEHGMESKPYQPYSPIEREPPLWYDVVSPQ
ncbi:hypothetical protein POX_g08893 [Penicillium oxalicum]|uniref:hypothetical protein n=1 Tax=Penicillium oxalicum TaxID=69781 RepID=UPI0020B8992A|nr:hypothetical protein POX_g08893 [Penicillium oxalicum]KAI2786507.1 hypothetical protein POX_g08893 [Penicillium oxalicum]